MVSEYRLTDYRKKLVTGFLLFFLAVCVSGQEFSEYSIKAAFVYNFLDFTSWPENDAQGSNQKLICILGSNPFGGDLQSLIELRPHYSPVEVRVTTNLQDLTSCHLLFISRTERYRLSTILNLLNEQPVLTISDIPNFAANRGMIELRVQSDRIRLMINLDSVAASRLSLSSNLIELATIVTENIEAEQ